MRRYWDLFSQKGKVVLDDVDGEHVCLDRDGFISQTHNRFSFSDVRERGGIDTGVSERNWQGSGHSQPTRTWIVDDLEISQFRLGTVGRTKARTLTPRKWIDFTPKYDSDVCVSLLHHLLKKNE